MFLCKMMSKKQNLVVQQFSVDTVGSNLPSPQPHSFCLLNLLAHVCYLRLPLGGIPQITDHKKLLDLDHFISISRNNTCLMQMWVIAGLAVITLWSACTAPSVLCVMHLVNILCSFPRTYKTNAPMDHG